MLFLILDLFSQLEKKFKIMFKKIRLLYFDWIDVCFTNQDSHNSNKFISEYAEGSSNNNA